MTNRSILQWNAQGLRNKKDELLNLIHTHNSDIVAIQETMFWSNIDFKIPNYSSVTKHGHYNRTPHGGVSIFIHSSIPYHEIQLDTPIQAVAIRANLNRTMTICNIYSSRSHLLNTQLLEDLYRQLPKPCLIIGDFNSYNILWGSAKTDKRGKEIENFIHNHNLNIMNNGAPTRISYQIETAIDLSICSSEIENYFNWSVSFSPGDSDHCPIVISYDEAEHDVPGSKYWNMKTAQWDVYEASVAWRDLPEELNLSNEEALLDFYNRILIASTESIKQYETGKYYPKPWWCPELAQSKQKREHFYQMYRHNKSIANQLAWKKSRAQHKNMVKKKKRESWISFIENMNQNAPSSVIYESMRKIKGKPQRKINILHENGQTYSSIPEIANKLASHFSSVSSDNNYSDEFKAYREQNENPVNFTSNNVEIYNRPFTLSELQYSLSNTNNTSPGLDGVYYQMIKHLPNNAKLYFLRLLNRFWRQSYFPDDWNTAIIVAVPKPGKNHSLPTSYRPIALTSCLCKTFERMINERLIDYLDMNGILTNIQCGCRKNRSTMDHLARLEQEVRKAFATGEHLVSIFFDLEKAYDLTWRHGILNDLFTAGLRGSLPMYIAAFLHTRKFQVRLRNYLSDTHIQSNGVAQGSVLSVTLFALKINSIAQLFPTNRRLIASLYVDDLQIGISHPDLNVIQTELQRYLDNIHQWTNRNGFKFSIAKTKIMHFTTLPGLHMNKPVLKLGDSILPYTESMRFLGLIWDPKLTWKNHIVNLKAECTKLLGLLKSITSREWGADQYHRLQYCSTKVYRMYIRSKLDYGAPIYGSACSTHLNTLNTVANEALRIVTGAFRSTPIQTLQVLAGEMSLEQRREYLALRYYYKIKSNLNNPAQRYIVPLTYRTLFINKGLQLPLSLRIQNMLEKYRLRKMFVKPEFSYSLLQITVPSWSLELPDINFDLNQFSKLITPVAQYQQNYSRLCRTSYSNFSKIFTDGSKRAVGVGAAVVCNNTTRSASLPIEASIFSAEMHAVSMAVRLVNELRGERFVIFSDSFSVLKSLENVRIKHPVGRTILHDIYNLKTESRKQISLCWIPSHVGIHGNEAADRAAVAAAGKSEEYISIYYRDWYPMISDRIQENWTISWRTAQQKMYEIKESVNYWKRIRGISRRDEVVINRLRSGYCFFSHGYLMDRDGLPHPPICELCSDGLLTVKHVLIECRRLVQRRRVIKLFREQRVVTLKSLLGDNVPIVELIQYLKDINLYDSV